MFNCYKNTDKIRIEESEARAIDNGKKCRESLSLKKFTNNNSYHLQNNKIINNFLFVHASVTYTRPTFFVLNIISRALAYYDFVSNKKSSDTFVSKQPRNFKLDLLEHKNFCIFYPQAHI